MQITSDKACASAKADNDKQTDHPVEGTAGLAMRVSAQGTKTWTYRYRRASDRKMQRLSLGRYPDVTLKEARDRARKASNGVSDGADPVADRKTRRAAGSFEALAEQWVAFKQRQGRSVSYTGRSALRLANIPRSFLDMKAGDIKRVHVTGALDEIAKRGAQTETNRHQALVSAVLKWAVSEGLIEQDASQGVKRRFGEEPRDRVLSDAELKTFWQNIDGMKGSASAKLAMRLCFVLGQRPKEIVTLQRSKLALDVLQPTATIVKSASKNRVEHVVPLPRLAVELLRAAVLHAGGSEWVFPNPSGDGPIEAHALTVIVHRARHKKDQTIFGMRDVQLYDAKKTIATFLGNAGHPDQFIGLLFNHLSARTSVTGKHYNHATYMTQKRQLVEEWAAHLENVLGIAASAASNVVEFQKREAV